jgi:hypothetical protein
MEKGGFRLHRRTRGMRRRFQGFRVSMFQSSERQTAQNSWRPPLEHETPKLALRTIHRLLAWGVLGFATGGCFSLLTLLFSGGFRRNIRKKHNPANKVSGRAKIFCRDSNSFNNRSLKEAKAPEKATAIEILSLPLRLRHWLYRAKRRRAERDRGTGKGEGQRPLREKMMNSRCLLTPM